MLKPEISGSGDLETPYPREHAPVIPASVRLAKAFLGFLYGSAVLLFIPLGLEAARYADIRVPAKNALVLASLVLAFVTGLASFLMAYRSDKVAPSTATVPALAGFFVGSLGPGMLLAGLLGEVGAAATMLVMPTFMLLGLLAAMRVNEYVRSERALPGRQ